MMAGVLSYGAAFGLCRHGRVLSESNQACAGVAVCLFASAWFAAQIFDTSYDGMAYHQAGAIAFSLGWNPIYQPHVVGWWLDAYPSSGELGRFIANGGLWVDHYAKGSWVLGALMHSATGSLNATKWVSPYLSVIAALSVYRGMRDCAIGRHPAAFLSFSAAFSPVVVAQFGTNYVDGAMASALLIQCGAFLSWNVRRSSLDIFVVLFAATLASNFKFTGLPYSVMLLFVVGASVFAFDRSFFTREPKRLVTAFMLAICCSLQTYAHNFLTHGHPFYPVNEINVVENTMSEEFYSRSRFGKFLAAATNADIGLKEDVKRQVFATKLVSSNELANWIARGLLGGEDAAQSSVIRGNPEPRFSIPTLWPYIILGTDTKLSGFGTLFFWALLIVPFALLASVIRPGIALDRRTGSVGLLMGWIAVSASAMPEFWWARYAPQLWLLPVFAALFAFMAGRIWIGWLLAFASVAGAVLAMSFWGLRVFGSEQPRVRADLATMAAAGRATVLNGPYNNDGLFVFAHHLRRLDVQWSLEADPAKCRKKIGIVMVCEGRE